MWLSLCGEGRRGSGGLREREFGGVQEQQHQQVHLPWSALGMGHNLSAPAVASVWSPPLWQLTAECTPDQLCSTAPAVLRSSAPALLHTLC